MDTGTVCDGWLLKSPPERSFCRAPLLSSFRPRWQRRWFILKPSGQIPGQYILEYFTDSTCRKRKGQIDLDQCETVESELIFNNKKYNCRHMFIIQTPRRRFHLVAELETDMKKWVGCICSVCRLNREADEDQVSPNVETVLSNTTHLATSTPLPSLAAVPPPSKSNLSSTPSDSSPYIQMSECTTGEPVENGVKDFGRSSDNLDLTIVPKRSSSTDDEFYDRPRPNLPPLVFSQKPKKAQSSLRRHLKSEGNRKDEDDTILQLDFVPGVNWENYPHEESSNKSLDSTNYDTPLNTAKGLAPAVSDLKTKSPKIVNRKDSAMRGNDKDSPPRPPKPASLEKRKYVNTEFNSSDTGSTNVPFPSKNSMKCKSVPENIFSFEKDGCKANKDLSPSSKVPLPSASKDSSLDHMYDFPRRKPSINLSSSKSSSVKSIPSRLNTYSNAPPGNPNARDIMNYHYPPTLNRDSSVEVCESDTESQLSPPSSGVSLGQLSPPSSGASIGPYQNLDPSPGLNGLIRVPPEINRSLKPKKKGFGSTDSGSEILKLAPVPGPKTGSTKYPFCNGKPRAAPSPTPGVLPTGNPAIPYHLSSSTHSDEDSSIVGETHSADDELLKRWIPPPTRLLGDIHYLELDMESDSNNLQLPKPADRSASSIVYRTVDFTKTKALNEVKQDCEKSYRKS